jgi:hypothetical protein
MGGVMEELRWACMSVNLRAVRSHLPLTHASSSSRNGRNGRNGRNAATAAAAAASLQGVAGAALDDGELSSRCSAGRELAGHGTAAGHLSCSSRCGAMLAEPLGCGVVAAWTGRATIDLAERDPLAGSTLLHFACACLPACGRAPLDAVLYHHPASACSRDDLGV